MLRLMRSSLAGLLIMSTLAGCGQKGPLYMPSAKSDQTSTNAAKPECPTKRCQATQPHVEAPE